MKKFLSVLLSVIMILSMSLPAFAAVKIDKTIRYSVPIISIPGDGTILQTKDGKNFSIESLMTPFVSNENSDDNSIIEAALNITAPLLFEGIISGNFDNYYKALQKEISDMYADLILDENGEISNETRLSDAVLNDYNYSITHDKKQNGGYGFEDYIFYYDWRLDPMATADKLNDFIKAIKKNTGYEKVALNTRCLGTAIAAAYLKKYGTDDICGIGLDGGVAAGNEIITDAFTGEIKVNMNSIARALADYKANGSIDVDDFLISTLSFIENLGISPKAIEAVKKNVLNVIFDGAVSALCLSTLSTMPSYWAIVNRDRFEDAKTEIFGEKGSEKREKYAGLIEKIDNYHENVAMNLEDILQDVQAKGVKIAVVSKYGFQMLPVVKNSTILGDEQSSVYSSSFGATTSTLDKTLPADYLANADESYISSDKKIDASTCLFPENTWFIKGALHANWTYFEFHLIAKVITSDVQLTVHDNDKIFNETAFSDCVIEKDSRFFVYDSASDPGYSRDGNAHTMTEENCNTENWLNIVDEVPKEEQGTGKSMLKVLLNWAINLLKTLIILLIKSV